MANVQKWQDYHPDYIVAFWRNVDVREFFPALVPSLERIPIMALVSDLLRYQVVERFGGIYFDTDILPLRSMEALRTKYGKAFTVCEWSKSPLLASPDEYVSHTCNSINNCILAGAPHQPIFQEIVNVTMANKDEFLKKYDQKLKLNPNEPMVYSLSTAGPLAWSRVVSRHKNNITRFNNMMFQPCGWGAHKRHCKIDVLKANPHVYSVHEFKKSWNKARSMNDTNNQQDRRRGRKKQW